MEKDTPKPNTVTPGAKEMTITETLMDFRDRAKDVYQAMYRLGLVWEQFDRARVCARDDEAVNGGYPFAECYPEVLAKVKVWMKALGGEVYVREQNLNDEWLYDQLSQ